MLHCSRHNGYSLVLRTCQARTRCITYRTPDLIRGRLVWTLLRRADHHPPRFTSLVISTRWYARAGFTLASVSDKTQSRIFEGSRGEDQPDLLDDIVGRMASEPTPIGSGSGNCPPTTPPHPPPPNPPPLPPGDELGKVGSCLVG